jgi:hypothetical protein
MFVVLERVLDAAVPHRFVAVDASGVDAEQNLHTGAGAAGDLWRRYTSVETQGDS